MNTNDIDSNIRNSAMPSTRSRHIPHAVFGFGAIALVLLAAVVLILVSGHTQRSTGAVIVLAAGVPAMIGIALIVAQKWRRARLGHT